jgi:hypothetical protein
MAPPRELPNSALVIDCRERCISVAGKAVIALEGVTDVLALEGIADVLALEGITDVLALE